MGKGYALKKGILKSNKKWILTIDADLSVDFSQLEIWKKKNYLIETENIAYFGSRIIKGSKMKAILIRKFIGFFFRIFQNLLISSEIKDTQCGFKLYNASYVKGIFTKLKTFGFAHDVEIIHLLQNENIKILELPIIWIHKSGSKINIMLHSFTMFFEIIKIKFRFMLK